MKPLKQKLTLEQFEKYVQEKDFGTLPPTFLVIHHTWKPTKESWNGKKTIDALDKYYRGLGWGGNGPHLFVAEDGIWLFTDMYDVGIHAGNGNGSLTKGYSIGIEVVGNYDYGTWEGETKKNALGVIRALRSQLKIPDSEIRFHREFNNKKTCPGAAITHSWLMSQLNNKQEEFMGKKLDAGNVKKILDKLGEMFGENYGTNPNDRETKEILENLDRLNVKYAESLQEIEDLKKKPLGMTDDDQRKVAMAQEVLSSLQNIKGVLDEL